MVGGKIPKEYIPACIKGLKKPCTTASSAGYQVIDIKVDIVDGSFHEVDSNELAFKMAAIFSLKDALKKAKPILLEPIMKVEDITPEEYQGDIIGDLNRRRARISGMETKGSLCTITAEVPLAEMFGYATAIRSLSKGAFFLFDGAIPLRAGSGQRPRRRSRSAKGLSRLHGSLTASSRWV